MQYARASYIAIKSIYILLLSSTFLTGMLAVELLLDLLVLLPLARDAEPAVLLAEPDLFIGVADVGRFSSFFFASYS
jgi:hypothetical protein